MTGNDVTELLSAVKSTADRSPVGPCCPPDGEWPPAPPPLPLLELATPTTEDDPPFLPEEGVAGEWEWPSADLGRVLLCSLRESSFLTACGLAAPGKKKRKRIVLKNVLKIVNLEKKPYRIWNVPSQPQGGADSRIAAAFACLDWSCCETQKTCYSWQRGLD